MLLYAVLCALAVIAITWRWWTKQESGPKADIGNKSVQVKNPAETDLGTKSSPEKDKETKSEKSVPKIKSSPKPNRINSVPETDPPGASPNDSEANIKESPGPKSNPELVPTVDEEKVQLENSNANATAEANQVGVATRGLQQPRTRGLQQPRTRGLQQPRTRGLQQPRTESQTTETTKEHNADSTSERQLAAPGRHSRVHTCTRTGFDIVTCTNVHVFFSN